jgi:hypothetical protein
MVKYTKYPPARAAATGMPKSPIILKISPIDSLPGLYEYLTD